VLVRAGLARGDHYARNATTESILSAGISPLIRGDPLQLFLRLLYSFSMSRRSFGRPSLSSI